MNLNEYIIPSRFDLIAKYLYIKYTDLDINTGFYKELYCKHIKTFNNCYEYPGTKNNIDDFINSLNRLISDIKKNGYNNDHPIPIYNKLITNGAHRLMTSYYYNIIPKFIDSPVAENTDYNYDFFINRKENPPLDKIYSDTMALEYLKIKKDMRAIIIYPSINRSKLENVLELIGKRTYIYYKKEIVLNNNGLSNLIKEMYRGEEWIGGMFPIGINPGGKYNVCKGDNSVVLLLVNLDNIDICVNLKEQCREIFGIGKHSMHISDGYIDTFRIASVLLNDNSIHFLQNGINTISNRSQLLLDKYFDYFNNNLDSVNFKNEHYCITGSIIMEMYGLRSAKDIDYITKDSDIIGIKDIDIHNGKWLSYYNVDKHDIIYNPKYHFYFNGFKFASLETIYQMKRKRGEKKDIDDVRLMCNSIL